MPETLDLSVLDDQPHNARGREAQPPKYLDDVAHAVKAYRDYFTTGDEDKAKAPLFGVSLDDPSKASSVRNAISLAARELGVAVSTWDLTKNDPPRHAVAFRVVALEPRATRPRAAKPDAAGAASEDATSDAALTVGGGTAAATPGTVANPTTAAR